MKQGSKVSSNANSHRWSPPPEDALKINTDGSFKEKSFSGGWGFTICNNTGSLIAAGAGNLVRVSSPLHAEAHAMLQAAIIASQMGCQNVIFGTDSVALKQAVNSEDYDLSSLGAMFREIKFHLRLGFHDVTVVNCP